jgi:hypothetical protein
VVEISPPNETLSGLPAGTSYEFLAVGGSLQKYSCYLEDGEIRRDVFKNKLDIHGQVSPYLSLESELR